MVLREERHRPADDFGARAAVGVREVEVAGQRWIEDARDEERGRLDGGGDAAEGEVFPGREGGAEKFESSAQCRAAMTIGIGSHAEPFRSDVALMRSERAFDEAPTAQRTAADAQTGKREGGLPRRAQLAGTRDVRGELHGQSAIRRRQRRAVAEDRQGVEPPDDVAHAYADLAVPLV